VKVCIEIKGVSGQFCEFLVFNMRTIIRREPSRGCFPMTEAALVIGYSFHPCNSKAVGHIREVRIKFGHRIVEDDPVHIRGLE
jgi:hypothetical protein